MGKWFALALLVLAACDGDNRPKVCLRSHQETRQRQGECIRWHMETGMHKSLQFHFLKPHWRVEYVPDDEPHKVCDEYRMEPYTVDVCDEYGYAKEPAK